MPKKIKVTEIKEEPTSYDDVVDNIKSEEAVVETPPIEEPPLVEEVSQVVETSPVEVTPEPTKKEKAMGTCEACGKTMTMKNLKYAHKLICTSIERDLPDLVEEEPVVEEPPTPIAKPRIKRTTSKTYVDAVKEDVEVKPEPKPKAKAVRAHKTVAKVDNFQEMMNIQNDELAKVEPRKIRFNKRAELYDRLATEALP